MDTLVQELASETDYSARCSHNQQWHTERSIPRDVKVGDLLDVRDTLYIWCVGVVKQLLKTNDGKHTLLLIRYKDWHPIYDELIPSSSVRLAPVGMYSQRPGLPNYPRRPAATIFELMIQDPGRDFVARFNNFAPVLPFR